MIYGTELTEPVPDLDLLTLLFDSELCRAKEDTAIHAEADDARNPLTKAGARTLAKQIAHFLRSAFGIGAQGPGKDVVVCYSTAHSRLAAMFFAVIAAEGVFSGALSSFDAAALVRRIRDGPAKVLVCSADLGEQALAAAREVGMPASHVLVYSYVHGREGERGELSLQSIDGTFQCAWTGPGLQWRRITDPAELSRSLIALVYTSGTSGTPKGAHISHANIVAQCFIPSTINRRIWDTWTPPAWHFRTLGHLNPGHISVLQGYYVNAFWEGGIVFWMAQRPSNPFDLVKFAQLNAQHAINAFFTLPTLWKGIAMHPLVKPEHFASLRIGWSGGGPMRPALQAAASSKLGGGRTLIGQTWGATECTGVASFLPPGTADQTCSLGPLLPGARMRLVDPAAREDLDVAAGEPGEALVHGPMVTKAYHNNPEANQAAFTADGWWRTGDILRLDGDYLYFVDRKKDLIRTECGLVAPSEIENAIRLHPHVQDVAVVGVPAESGTAMQVPRAYIVPAKDQTDQDQDFADSVADFIKDKVPDHKQLRGGVFLLDAIPYNPVGKICRDLLLESYPLKERITVAVEVQRAR